MKKTNLIALGTIISFLLMGTAYAAWTESLSINHIVDTGHLTVIFEEDPILNAINKEEYVTVNVIPTPDDPREITVEINNLYPGAGGGFSYKMINRGTIPAKFDSLEYSNITDPHKLNEHNILSYVVSLQKYNMYGMPISSSTFNSYGYNVETLANKIGTKMSNWDGNGNPLILEPGDYVLFESPVGDSLMPGYFVSMHPNQTGYENATLGFKLNFNFKQFNQ